MKHAKPAVRDNETGRWTSATKELLQHPVFASDVFGLLYSPQ